MTKSDYDAPSAPLFSKLQILPLEQIYNLNLSIIIHKFHNNRLPTPTNLIPIHHFHHYNTRLSNNQNYFQNFNRINLGQQTYISKGLKFWQSIPTDFKNLPIHLFKKKVKSHLLKSLT